MINVMTYLNMSLSVLKLLHNDFESSNERSFKRFVYAHKAFLLKIHCQLYFSFSNYLNLTIPRIINQKLQ